MPSEPYVTKTGVVVRPEHFQKMGEALIFRPFVVRARDSRPLAERLSAGELEADAELLVVAHKSGEVIALSRKQMAYHHVAQGELRGQPWLVFF